MMMLTQIRVGQCKRCSGAAGINPVQLLNPPPTPLVIILITNVFIIVTITNVFIIVIIIIIIVIIILHPQIKHPLSSLQLQCIVVIVIVVNLAKLKQG